MKKLRLRHPIAAAAVAVVATVGLGASPALAATDSVSAIHRPARLTLTGEWFAVGSDGVNEISNEVTFFDSRTLAIDFPGRIYDGQGLWQQSRGGAFSFYQQHPDFDESGTLVGWTRADVAGRQTGPDTLTGAGPVRSYDLQGRITLELQVTFRGTRLPG
jgi:hypothetical protein